MKNYQHDEKSQEEIYYSLKEEIAKTGKADVDLCNLRSLPPSVAYNAFARIVEDYGLRARSMLVFHNDHRQLSKRIWDAFDRKEAILRSEGKLALF